MDDMKQLGKELNICPYFLSKELFHSANIVVFNYMYLLDSKISSMIPEALRKDAIVVFDEAHNIDDVCIEAYEVKVNKLVLEQSSKNLNRLKS